MSIRHQGNAASGGQRGHGRQGLWGTLPGAAGIVQAGDIVEPDGAGVQRGLCHLDAKGVDGKGQIKLVSQGADDRRHAADLLLDRNIGVAGPGGIAADVDRVSAGGGELSRKRAGGGDRVRGISQPVAGKGVGCHVKNCHHARGLTPVPNVVAERHHSRRHRRLEPVPQLADSKVQAGMPQVRLQVQQRSQNKVPFGNANVGNRQAGRIDDGIIVEEDVQVDVAGTVADRLGAA